MKIQKTTKIQNNQISETDLKLINQFTLEELKADEIFSFKAVLCDNQIDRDSEAFSDKALEKMAELFVGKTVIKDHTPTADNQIARIYRTGIIEESGIKQLIAYCYMVKTSGNSDLIKEIQGGIKKEGSVSGSVNEKSCSICGTNQLKSHCKHVLGKLYNGKTCYHILNGVEDCYEFSLVAVPAQRNAGVHKNFDTNEEESLKLRLRLAKMKNEVFFL